MSREINEVNKYSSYDAWETQCRMLGLKNGPHKLYGRPYGSWQFVDDSGTAAMWNGEHSLGSIFRAPDSIDGAQ